MVDTMGSYNNNVWAERPVVGDMMLLACHLP